MTEKRFGRWVDWPREERSPQRFSLNVRGFGNGVKAAGRMRMDSYEFMQRNGNPIEAEDDAPIMSKAGWD